LTKEQYRSVRDKALGYCSCGLKREVKVVCLGKGRKWLRHDDGSIMPKKGSPSVC